MNPLYDEFISYLDAEDKEKCVRLVLSSLQKGSIDIVTLYNDILTPAMYADFCKEEEQERCIWKEHVRTSIVRTVIECCYPFITAERDNKYHSPARGRAVVVCPPEELHETGARMVADFFTLCGYDVTFVGANMPVDDVINALKFVEPAYVAISITNYYNLVATRKLITRIRDAKGSASFRVVLGGQACQGNPDTCRELGADMVLHTFEDIRKLGEA